MGSLSVWPALAVAVMAQEAPQAPRDWRQGVEYRLEARLDEAAELLEGAGRIRYRNDSPDTLRVFYLHLHLNAFRPNSAWARRDLEHGVRTFQDLGPEEHGFERIRELTVDGGPARMRWPYAPDSTVVAVDLPQPLLPGGTLTLDVRWDARPSTVPRRQGRRGRHYDFAQWYPRVVVYDRQGWRPHPLYRAGEFYGEFATYDVTLDLAEDQVTGATGVPVSGDPGWERAAVPGTGPIDDQRDWYGSSSGPPCVERGGERVCGVYPARSLRPPERLGHLAPDAAPGRKRVRWYAEDVHHFAWSTNPEYVYEQGRWQDVAIHVLYRPGDEREWGGGTAVRRTAVALQWLDSIFGDYAYPQVTNLHRLERGGTEFPMLVMDGSASQGLILHEVGHIYAHGILANNEWHEGWLDEGMSSFQTAWFDERGGVPDPWASDRRATILSDLAGVSQPVVLDAEDYASQDVYSDMVYGKGSVILWMLREMVGDETMVRILRTWYERNRLRHVDSRGFQEVAEEVTHRDLDWFFAQWLHGTGVVDYALEDVEVRADAGGWLTSFELRRVGEQRMPVPVRLTGAGAVADTVVDEAAPTRRVVVRTAFRPDAIRLDPGERTLDWNPSNDGWAAGWLRPGPGWDVGWDDPIRPLPERFDAVPVGILPLVWVNDAGGWVAGAHIRSSLLGIHTTEVRLGLPAIPAGERGEGGRTIDPGSVWLRSRNPVVGTRPVRGLELELFAGEGRGSIALGWEGPAPRSVDGDPRPTSRLRGTVVHVEDEAYLVPGRWDPGRRSAAELGAGLAVPARGGGFDWRLSLDGGAGFDTDAHRWLRGALRADGRRELAGGWGLRARLFAGGASGTDDPAGEGEASGDRVPAERRFFLSSADPWATLSNPWSRSAGAPLADRAWFPGGGALLGFDPTLSLAWIATAALELAAPTAEVGGADGFPVRPLGFAGAGTGARPGLPPEDGPGDDRLDAGTLLWSAGVGIELGRAGSPLRLRVDLPLLVSHPALARDAREERAGLRVQVGFGG